MDPIEVLRHELQPPLCVRPPPGGAGRAAQQRHLRENPPLSGLSGPAYRVVDRRATLVAIKAVHGTNCTPDFLQFVTKTFRRTEGFPAVKATMDGPIGEICRYATAQ